ncbi:MAG TPA: V4R domain-containing protein [Nitrososphaerales archaeon]|nr:V4R domain-containing protein [Nitrososphaerales archaeon]
METGSLAGEALPAKEVLTYYYAKGRRVFQGSVWLRNVPGALANVTTELARSGANIIATSSSSIPNTDLAEWSFFAEAGVGWAGLKHTQDVLAKSPEVVKCVLKEGVDGTVVDTLHYPLRLSTGERALVIEVATFRKMFDRILSDFGPGGRVIIYELGLASGLESNKHFAHVLGSENIAGRVPHLVSLYTAQGWGRVGPADGSQSKFSLQPFRGTVKIYDSFECTGVKSEAPNSDFIRGHIEGFARALVGRQVSCRETKCVSMGDELCQFEASE